MKPDEYLQKVERLDQIANAILIAQYEDYDLPPGLTGETLAYQKSLREVARGLTPNVVASAIRELRLLPAWSEIPDVEGEDQRRLMEATYLSARIAFVINANDYAAALFNTLRSRYGDQLSEEETGEYVREMRPLLELLNETIALMDPGKEGEADFRKTAEENAKLIREKIERAERFLGESKRSGCFIATAVLDPGSESLAILRNFRDQILQPSVKGSRFVGWYYRWSPAAATVIGSRPLAKFLVRTIVVRPAVWLVSLVWRGFLEPKGDVGYADMSAVQRAGFNQVHKVRR